MYRYYFPSCPIEGPIDPPVPYAHAASYGAIPNKCAKCDFTFEGSCVRYSDIVNDYMHLDHGPCGIPGSTEPVTVENDFVFSKVKVPHKCSTCHYLDFDNIHGFYCSKDSDKWGDFHRSLDWGDWKPEKIYIHLDPPKRTNKDLVNLAYDEKLIEFIKEHRKINPEGSIGEAKEDYKFLRGRIESLP